MNRKIKLITPTLCGLVLASNLAFTTVQAAPVNKGTPTKVARVRNNMNFTMAISPDGMIFYDEVPGATRYKIMYAWVGHQVGTLGTTNGYTGKFDVGSAFKNYPFSPGDYMFYVYAYNDSSKDSIARANIYVSWDGKNFKTIY